VALAGKSFCLNKDNKAELIKPAGDDEKTIQEAIKGCPVEAISDE